MSSPSASNSEESSPANTPSSKNLPFSKSQKEALVALTVAGNEDENQYISFRGFTEALRRWIVRDHESRMELADC